MLSVLVFLPLLAAVVLAAVPRLGDRPGPLGVGRRQPRSSWSWSGWSGPRYATPAAGALAFEEQVPLDPGGGQQLPRRRRRAVVAAGGPHRRGVRRVLGVRAARGRPAPAAGRPVPVPAVDVPGPVRRGRPDPLLRLLRPVHRGDVLRHRRVGARGPGPVGAEVLPLHVPRLAGAAARLHRAVRRVVAPHVRHGRARRRPPAARRRPGGRAGPGRGAAGSRGEDADRALPHLAPAGPHRRARDRLGCAGRSAPQDGHVRLRADRHAHAPRGLA